MTLQVTIGREGTIVPSLPLPFHRAHCQVPGNDGHPHLKRAGARRGKAVIIPESGG